MTKDKQIKYTGTQVVGVTTVRDAIDAIAAGGGGGGGNPKEIHVTLNDIVTGTTPTYIGGIYVDRAGNINSQSKAYIGCMSVGDTATLALHASGSPTPLVSVSVTGTLSSVDFSGTTAISVGWYDILLYAAGSAQTAVARGLYIHV